VLGWDAWPARPYRSDLGDPDFLLTRPWFVTLGSFYGTSVDLRARTAPRPDSSMFSPVRHLGFSYELLHNRSVCWEMGHARA